MRHRDAPLGLEDVGTLDWDKMQGLLPAVVQDRATLQLLMLAYVSQDALQETIRTRRAIFYSRSRQELWRKGETSGAWLENAEVFSDCDNDALLILADPAGPVCHLGSTSCFTTQTAPGLGWLAELERIIEQRIADGDGDSYTKKLSQGGIKRVAQKVGEEGVETALAATGGEADDLVEESADLMFHLLVLLRMKNLSLADVAERLRQRHAESRR